MASTPRDRLDQRLADLKRERTDWVGHWQELADQLLPRRGRLFQGRQPAKRTQPTRLINSSPLHSRRVTVSGMSSGLTNPTMRWFRLGTDDEGLEEREGVRAWLDDVEEQLYRVFAASGLYDVLPASYEELLCFGTAAVWHDEDREHVCRFAQLPIGEFMLAADESGRASICYREFERTTAQLVERFGLDACSMAVRQAWDKGGYEDRHKVCHALEPISRRVEGLSGADRWPFVSIYWEPGETRRDRFLSVSGYHESPAHCPRWDVAPPDVYGWSPGMDVLGDCKQLQHLERRKMQAADRATGFGPTQGPAVTGAQGIDLSPEAHNPVPQGADYRIRPIFEVPPNAVQLIAAEILQVEQRINRGLFADLFLMMSMDARQQRATATEVVERREEKLLVLGPMLTRSNTELFDPLIDRAFNILLRASMPRWEAGLPAPLPEPPEELAGQDLKIRYVSLLQQALQQVKLGAIEGVLRVALPLAQAKPDVLDKLDMDQVLDEVARAHGAPAGVLRSDDAVAELRAAKAQEMQARQEAAMLAEAAKAAPMVTGAAKDMAQIEAGQRAA